MVKEKELCFQLAATAVITEPNLYAIISFTRYITTQPSSVNNLFEEDQVLAGLDVLNESTVVVRAYFFQQDYKVRAAECKLLLVNNSVRERLHICVNVCVYTQPLKTGESGFVF